MKKNTGGVISKALPQIKKNADKAIKKQIKDFRKARGYEVIS